MKALKTVTVAQKALDLGLMQNEVEASTLGLKKANAELQKANEAFNSAEERYGQANKALLNGVNALRAATKMPL